MITEHIWFEVRIGSGCTSHTTLEEAQAELADMKIGYKNKHPFMTDENRGYHQRVSSKAEILKVIQTAEKVI